MPENVDQSGTTGGGVTAGGSTGQSASNVEGNVRQMTVGDVLDLAVQQNIDIAPVLDILNDLNLSPEVKIASPEKEAE